MKKSILIFLFSLAYTLLLAHPIKIATLLVEKTTTLPMLTINLFEDDFIAHINKIYRTKIDLSKNDAKTTLTINDYINKHLIFKDKNGNKLTLILITITVLKNQNVVQIKYTINSTQRQLEVLNTLLFDAFDNQKNILHYTNNLSEKKMLEFYPSDNQKKIAL